jgi:PAS domain S-box-containing protein
VTELGHARDGPAARNSAAPALLFAAGVVATGGAVYVIAVSNIAPHPVAQSLVTAVVCLTFVCTGAVALRLQPYARFGLLLAAVGFASLISVLHEANGATAYTIGVLASNVVFALLVHAFLAFPSGRLRSRSARLLAAAAYLTVLGLQAVAVLFDPLTRYHSDHPRNVALVDAHAGLATGLEELEAAIALAITVAVATVLTRRARAATPAARRQLVPVLVGGTFALLLFSIGLFLAPLSSHAGLVGFGLGLLAALALPGAFLAMLVRERLSRGAVGELLLELRDPDRPPDLEEALRRALGDPSLRLGRLRSDEGYVDEAGAPLVLPPPGDVQVATPILHQGDAIGVLVHDRSLKLRRELLDAVSAAASFALANERALHDAQLAEQRSRALLDAIPDGMLRITRDGTALDIRPDTHSALLGPPEELVGHSVHDLLPSGLATRVLDCVRRTLDSGTLNTIEYELTIGGVARWKEARMVPSAQGEVVAMSRDITEQRRAEAEQQRLGAEQASLRRVATLVAGNAAPEQVFQTVTEEVCRLLGLRTAVLHRFEDVQTSTIVGKFGEPTGRFELGNVVELETGAALDVLRTGAPARSDYTDLVGTGAVELRALGFRGSVGVPITVAGVTWGALVVALREEEVLPLETERRLQAFAELVGLAVASADARDELAASRLRIIEASDTERRRLERNLHDGAQQRLVALMVGLRLVQAELKSRPHEAGRLLETLTEELGEALTELRELAQGIHPAVLTERGLEAALEVLGSRTPLPVALDVRLPERLPEPVETAAYYAVSEALANVVKHSHASRASVRVERLDGLVTVEISDDGVGGAEAERGSGLRGLRDRVDTLDGLLWLESPPGRGTLIRVELPVRSGKLATVQLER